MTAKPITRFMVRFQLDKPQINDLRRSRFNANGADTSFIMVCPTGIEPAAFRVGV